MTVVHRARWRAGVQQPIRPRPADGGSMMPLAAALLRTLGVDLCAATPKAWPVTITRWTGIRGAVASGRGLAGVSPSERTAKFAADMRLGSTAHDCPTRHDSNRRTVTIAVPP